jgi:hypothetical protein
MEREDPLEERKRQDKEKAEDNRARQKRQGVISEEGAETEAAPEAAPEAASAAPPS